MTKLYCYNFQTDEANMRVKADRQTTLAGRIAATISAQIAARHYAAGEKLPSVRAMAARMSASTSTVVEAYDILVADGLIAARRGSGFFVTGPMPLLNLAAVGPSPDRVVDPLWISRQTLDASSETSRPGCGWLPADWMPEAPLRRALRDMARAPADILAFYGPSTGHAGLRGLIARRLMARDIEARPGRADGIRIAGDRSGLPAAAGAG